MSKPVNIKPSYIFLTCAVIFLILYLTTTVGIFLSFNEVESRLAALEASAVVTETSEFSDKNGNTIKSYDLTRDEDGTFVLNIVQRYFEGSMPRNGEVFNEYKASFEVEPTEYLSRNSGLAALYFNSAEGGMVNSDGLPLYDFDNNVPASDRILGVYYSGFSVGEDGIIVENTDLQKTVMVDMVFCSQPRAEEIYFLLYDWFGSMTGIRPDNTDLFEGKGFTTPDFAYTLEMKEQANGCYEIIVTKTLLK